jgi:ABC-type multidrug transport system ATPase subunit
VGRRFGRRVVLEPLDLDLSAGDVVALAGPNGAGKSTLLAILARALPPTAGTVAQDGAIRVGWMPQRPGLYGRLTPRENLELFAGLARLEPRAQAVERALAVVGLEHERRRTSDLSVGNAQRLNLAVGLLGEPRVLLLDEPTASLDRAHRRRLWSLVDDLRDDGGAVLFSTHSHDEARRAARLLVLEDGAPVYDGPPEGLQEDVT